MSRVVGGTVATGGLRNQEERVDRFEYELVTWAMNQSGQNLVAVLNSLGDEGWEVVGMAPRASTAPVPGFGVDPISEISILVKRVRPQVV